MSQSTNPNLTTTITPNNENKIKPRSTKPLCTLQHNNLIPKRSPSPKNNNNNNDNTTTTMTTNNNTPTNNNKPAKKSTLNKESIEVSTTPKKTFMKKAILLKTNNQASPSWIISPTSKSLLKCLHIFSINDSILDSNLYKTITFNSLKDGQILSKMLQSADGEENITPYTNNKMMKTMKSNNNNNNYKGRRHTISTITTLHSNNDDELANIYTNLKLKLKDTPSYHLFQHQDQNDGDNDAENDNAKQQQQQQSPTFISDVLEMLLVYIILYSLKRERYVSLIMNELDINAQNNIKLILEKYHDMENNNSNASIATTNDGDDEKEDDDEHNTSNLSIILDHLNSSINNNNSHNHDDNDQSSSSLNVSLNLSMDTPYKNEISKAKTIVNKLIIETSGTAASNNLLYTPSPIALSMSSHNLNRSDNSDLDVQIPRKSTIRQRRARQALQAQTPTLSDLSNDSMFDSPSVTERKQLRKENNIPGEIKSYKDEILKLKQEIKYLQTKSTKSTRLERENLALKDEMAYLQKDLIRVSDECLQFKSKYEDLHKQLHEQALNNVDTISSIEIQFTNTVKELKQKNKNLSAELNRIRKKDENFKNINDELDELRSMKVQYDKVNVSWHIMYIYHFCYIINVYIYTTIINYYF